MPFDEVADRLLERSRLALLGRVLPSVLHQLSTPLGAVALRAEALADPAEGPAVDPGKRQRYLKAIVDETRRCQELVGTLRDLASPAGPAEAVFDIVPICRATVRLLEHEALRRQVALVLEGERVLAVTGNAPRLGQAVLTLALNALDASPRGGRVRIASERREGGHVAIAVEDQGEEVPAPLRLRLLEPWESSPPSDYGPDLGLTASRLIAGMHGGSLALETLAPRGNRFVLQLPAKTADDGV